MPFGIYIHWPFCLSLCPYCDFNSYIKNKENEDELVGCIEKQLEYFYHKTPKQVVTSIYFGGGTPSLMHPNSVGRLIDKINSLFTVDINAEVTLEANPTSFEIEKFRSFKQVGINRLSIGVQSFNDANLLFLGRKHSAKQAIFAIEESIKIFHNTTFDLIYALPKQTIDEWQKELEFALNFNTDHLSLYTLTIEPGTPFANMVTRGILKPKQEDDVYDFMKLTYDITKNAEFQRYEISNYARNEQYSRHNMVYWQQFDYIGVGPGAHGRLFYNNKSRYETECIAKPNNFIKNTLMNDDYGLITESVISNEHQIQEILLSGLRVVNGIDCTDIKNRFNFELLDFLDIDFLQKAINDNFVVYDKNYLKLTEKGAMLLHHIVQNILR